MESERILIKYTVPSKLCVHPRGFIWKQLHDDGSATLWINISSNPEESEWLLMGEFLMKVFASKIEDIDFIEDCLKRFTDL